jgi:hypothetical protein
MPASKHGLEMITVVVGEKSKWPAQTFAIHRNLLYLASAVFARKIDALGKGSSDITLKLPRDCPMAFAILYQWLYSGKILSTSFYVPDNEIRRNLFWLEVYTFADSRGLTHIRESAFQKLRWSFNGTSSRLPSKAFIKRLLRADCEGVLQEYMVCHVAFWLLQATERDNWSSRPGSRADHQGRFMLQVASKVAEWYSDSEPFSPRRHPSEYPPYGEGTEPSSPASSTTEEAATGDATRSCLLTPSMSSLELIESESDVEEDE